MPPNYFFASFIMKRIFLISIIAVLCCIRQVHCSGMANRIKGEIGTEPSFKEVIKPNPDPDPDSDPPQQSTKTSSTTEASNASNSRQQKSNDPASHRHRHGTIVSGDNPTSSSHSSHGHQHKHEHRHGDKHKKEANKTTEDPLLSTLTVARESSTAGLNPNSNPPLQSIMKNSSDKEKVEQNSNQDSNPQQQSMVERKSSIADLLSDVKLPSSVSIRSGADSFSSSPTGVIDSGSTFAGGFEKRSTSPSNPALFPQPQQFNAPSFPPPPPYLPSPQYLQQLPPMSQESAQKEPSTSDEHTTDEK